MEHPKYLGSLLAATLMSVVSLVALATEPNQDPQLEKGPSIEFRASLVPLYAPWKFHIGDSPVDPVTHEPLWAQTDFDDSAWEKLNLWPKSWTDYPGALDSAFVPGWTGRGHPGYSGFAWYRMRVNLNALPWQHLALGSPDRVDDAYQVFVNGTLLGGLGDFTGSRPVLYYNQPRYFVFLAPRSDRAYSPNNELESYPQLIALRVWMGPNTLASSFEAGGLRSKPLLGEESAIELDNRVGWNNLNRARSPYLIQALSFALLTIVAFSLSLLDRSDHVYLWMGGVSALTAAYSALGASEVWRNLASIAEDRLIVECLLSPLAYLGWFMFWDVWFDRQMPRWISFAAAGLTVIHVVSDTIFILQPGAIALETLSFLARLSFFGLSFFIAIRGIRRHGVDGWLVLAVIILLVIPCYEYELSYLRLSPTWLFFGAQITGAHVSRFLLAALGGLLLFRRLQFSVERHHLIALDAKRAQIQSDFVAAVSHEFRSPLTTLRTITELLAEGRITDESHRTESYVYLDHETTRLQRLVEDLLDFGRMESGCKQYRLILCDAFQLVRDAVADLTEQAHADGFHIETNLAPVPASIRADEEALRRAVRNLLENAMKYSPQCRTVWVYGTVDNRRVSISVRDHGMGIDQSQQRAIFQKFVRGDAAKVAGIKGTGLGLAMAQQVLKAIGGEIQLQSELGSGSTFTMVLPLVEG